MNTAELLGQRVLESLSSGDIEAAGPLVAEDFVDHGAPPWAPQGRAGYLQILGFLHAVLELRYEVHDVVAAADKVAIRATAHGVHNRGHLGFPPTGKAYAMPMPMPEPVAFPAISRVSGRSGVPSRPHTATT